MADTELHRVHCLLFCELAVHKYHHHFIDVARHEFFSHQCSCCSIVTLCLLLLLVFAGFFEVNDGLFACKIDDQDLCWISRLVVEANLDAKPACFSGLEHHGLKRLDLLILEAELALNVSDRLACRSPW